MKKSIFTFVFAFAMIFANAQQQDKKDEYKKAINELLQHAKNDFKDITGAKTREENGMIMSACTLQSEIGKSGDILNNTKTGDVVYSLLLKYNNTAKDIEKAVQEYINEKFPEPEYMVIYDSDEGWEEATVYTNLSSDKAKEFKQYLNYMIETDPKTNATTFELMIFEASAQKVKK